MLSLLKRGAPTELLTRERPPLEVSKVAPSVPPKDAGDEYARIAARIGFNHPHIKSDLQVEKFAAYLRQKDWGVFSLTAVIEYMNTKAAEESAEKAGWLWRPLRKKDDIRNALYGREAQRWQGGGLPASDFYKGPHKARQLVWDNNRQNQRTKEIEMEASALPYDKLVPLHALLKVDEIEREFSGHNGNPPVSFFVSDYAPAPHIQYPDPFLMAVVDNARAGAGIGRFVIDFWDEPGFGIDKQISDGL